MYSWYIESSCYNFSAILKSASATLLRVASMPSAWSFLCSRFNWEFLLWASSWEISSFPFLSRALTKWYCRLVVIASSWSSVATRILFRAPWELERISGFNCGQSSFTIPGDGEQNHWIVMQLWEYCMHLARYWENRTISKMLKNILNLYDNKTLQSNHHWHVESLVGKCYQLQTTKGN